MQICFKKFKITIKLSCWAVSTPIDIVIQRYLGKRCKKSLVNHVHIDRNSTLNIEPFQLGFIRVLSGRSNAPTIVL